MILKQLYINGKLQRQEIDAGVPTQVINDNIDWLHTKNEQLKKRGVKNLWRYETYYNGKMFDNGPFNGLIAKRKIWRKNNKEKWECDYIEIRIAEEIENPTQLLEKHLILHQCKISNQTTRRWEIIKDDEQTYYGTLKTIEKKLDKEYIKKGVTTIKKEGGIITDTRGSHLNITYLRFSHTANTYIQDVYISVNKREQREPIKPLRGTKQSHSFRTITEDEEARPAYKPNYKRIKREENEPYWQWNEQAKTYESISWINGKRTKGIL